jgi:hypothetical protein
VQQGPSFGVAFVYMGMSAFDQLGRLVASNINNNLTTAYDPTQTFTVITLIGWIRNL